MMIESESIKSAVIEGGDQVGKGDATMNLNNELLRQGYDVAQISFPCYATPTGYAIREILSKGFPEELNIDSDEALSIKMGLFALNRLEVVHYLSSLRNISSTVFLFDRGPFSNALTIAYDLFSRKEGSLEMLDSLVQEALDMDSYTIKKMNMSQCVINLIHVSEHWKVMREKEDLHDQEGVQELSKDIYSKFQTIFPQGWKNIPTRVNGAWKSRKDILADNYDFLRKKLALNGSSGRMGRLINLSIGEILEYSYGYSVPVSLSCLFDNALKNNCKKDLYGYGEVISKNVVSKSSNVKWKNEEIKSAVRNILKYSDNFEKVLNYTYNNDFGTKFVNSVLENE